ncbi:Spc98 family-domain-containing protein [Dichotomocladium elegans]|nr:Spc98 family-domain-containing protein [Dichotomocladium elegans]
MHSPAVGLSHMDSPPALDRPYEERNTRRRLAALTNAIDTSASPATQLTKARERVHGKDEKELSESKILRDLIFVLQGIDGQYIRFDKTTNEYTIDPSAYVPQPTRDLIRRVTELGWLYKQVQGFLRPALSAGTQQEWQQEAGLVGQAFCFALQRELVDYYKLIAVLEAQIDKQDSAASDDAASVGVPTEHTLTLRRLLLWTRESAQRLRLMSVLVDACRGQKGGALVSTMHNYTIHGDPFVRKYIKSMLQDVSKPFYEMLQRWIYEGELDDPYEEFFVACDPTVSEEALWQRKYSLRQNMVPSFISTELSQKIFLIGKSLNFIRYSCQEDAFMPSATQAVEPLSYGDIPEVERSIDVTYRETSQRLLGLLKTKYKLMDHLRALKRYLLLGQGDFIQQLMVALGSGLNRPANTLFRHNLTGILESAIRASNAQYDDPEILSRLDVRLLEISPQDLGWDVFTLDYHLDPPINTVFTPQAMHQYLRMFNFLWQLKRVEYTLTACWRRCCLHNSTIKKIKQDLHIAQISLSHMIHFCYQLQHYYLFEVLECSWEKLACDIEKKSIDLDAVIEAHDRYLLEISEKGFLSGAKNQALSVRLVEIFDTILGYKSVLDRLYAYGTSESAGDADKLEKIRDKRTDIEKKFEVQVLEFLDVLRSYDGEDLRSLSTRLNYNEHYSARIVKEEPPQKSQ